VNVEPTHNPDRTLAAGGVPRSDRLRLVVIAPNAVSNHDLVAGCVTLGRADRNMVVIDDPLLSREHARLWVDASGVQIEDLGAVNGIFVDGVRIAPHTRVALRLGSATAMGESTLVVQPAPRTVNAETCVAYEVWRDRARAACRAGFPFVVLRIELETAASGADAEIRAQLAAPDASLAVLAPQELVALVPRVAPADAERVCDAVEQAMASRGAPVRVGYASFPVDGVSAEELVARASPRYVEHDDEAPVFVTEAMRNLVLVLDRLARGSINVLVLGETGVGKEVVAEELHRRSPRAARPFVRVNCAALPDSLVESELFGHEKGAFTGAQARRQGLLEAADGGTVFLDEVGELSLTAQASLLRAIERREVMRVGGVSPTAVDIRFVAATNRELLEGGRFRQDLYYRLAGAVVDVPPLRSRTAELGPLTERFLRRWSVELGQPAAVVSARAMAMLEAYDWPGNVRELRNVIERAVLLAVDGVIEPEHLPLDRMRARSAAPTSRAVRTEALPPGSAPVLSPQDQAERQRMMEALRACGGNQSRASEALGVPRRTFTARMRRFGLTRLPMSAFL
jgi:two-component system response regulator AtoC